MAGRIRSIEPEINEDEVTAALTHEAWRLYVGSFALADDHGNFRASTKFLTGQIFHSRALPAGVTIDTLLDELSQKLIQVYTIDGQRYAHLRGWKKHQRIDNAGEPRLPLPPGWTVKKTEWTSSGRLRIKWETFPPPDGDPEPVKPCTDKVATAATLSGQDCHGGTPVTTALPPLDQDHRSPIRRGREDAAAAAASGPPAQESLPTPIGRVLERSRVELFGITDIGSAAARMSQAMDDEPRSKGVDRGQVAIEAVNHARKYKADHPLAAPERLLAEAEAKVGWILRDIRSGEWTRRYAKKSAPAESGHGLAPGAADDMLPITPPPTTGEVADAAQALRASAAERRGMSVPQRPSFLPTKDPK